MLNQNMVRGDFLIIPIKKSPRGFGVKNGVLPQKCRGVHFGAWRTILGGQSGLLGVVLAILVFLMVLLGAYLVLFGVKMGYLGGNGDITVLTRISVIPTINVPGNVKMVNAPSTGPRSADARAHLAAPSA